MRCFFIACRWNKRRYKRWYQKYAFGTERFFTVSGDSAVKEDQRENGAVNRKENKTDHALTFGFWEKITRQNARDYQNDNLLPDR